MIKNYNTMNEKENDVTNTNVSINVAAILLCIVTTMFCAVWVKIITRTKFYTTHFFALNRISVAFNDNRVLWLWG